MKENVKFILEREDQHVKVVVPANLTFGDLLEGFKTFALAVGYHPGTIKEFLGE